MIRKFLKKLSLREKLLLTGFIWVALLIWASSLWTSMRTLSSELSEAAQALDIQKRWMLNQPEIELRLQKAMAKMDPRKTYSKNKFIGRVDEMARKSGIRYDISNPQTRPDDVFNEHTLALQFKQASLRQLIAFDEALAKETPYIGLASLKLIPEKQNPYTLSAQWNLVALELSNLTEIGNMQSN